jgi:hypothetical protein
MSTGRHFPRPARPEHFFPALGPARPENFLPVLGPARPEQNWQNRIQQSLSSLFFIQRTKTAFSQTLLSRAQHNFLSPRKRTTHSHNLSPQITHLFECKNKRSSTLSGSKRLRRSSTVRPATLKSLSGAALEAGSARTCFANRDKRGNCFSFFV